ncbi:CBS domain-containing protein [Pedococcus sp. 5OH_020]|uniref:CBS domain-containing protein n=1 Tax=Pedococcus sp. 5OH_020 TaxID=2989814 RepID=UPI0022E9E02F|nr:CBS domain-containing protein [Pedococcus sp. 5OH_020]
MLVRELLTREVAVVREGSALDAAVRILAERGVSALPVVDAAGHVVGILSEADVLRLYLSADPRAHLRTTVGQELAEAPWPALVSDVMTPDPVTAQEGTDASDVAQLLADTGWKSVPVVDDHGVLVGMVSRSDVIRALSTNDAQIWLHVVRDFADLERTRWSASVVRGVITVRGVEAGREARLAAAIAATAPGARGVVIEDAVAGAPLERAADA